MSSTSLIQRSSSTLSSALTPSSSQRSLTTSDNASSSAILPTATSVLPRLNPTPQKSSTSTPQQQTPSPAKAPPTPLTPGQWQHPRMQEVIKRQNATRFDASNMRVIGLNAGFTTASVLVPLFANYLYAHSDFIAIARDVTDNEDSFPRPWLQASEPYASYTFWLLRAFFALNIILAFAPLFRPKDACEDVPLTPSQRQLLGLPPMSRPATPQEQAEYVTPPRYSRSATPNSGSSLRAQASGSPLSGRGTPLDGSVLRRSVSGSPRPSPLGGSGLGGGSSDRGRRTSFQSPPSGMPDFDSSVTFGATPTKSNKASVGLNSKWLYEKGRNSPRSSFSGLGGFGGGGSVFQ